MFLKFKINKTVNIEKMFIRKEYLNVIVKNKRVNIEKIIFIFFKSKFSQINTIERRGIAASASLSSIANS